MNEVNFFDQDNLDFSQIEDEYTSLDMSCSCLPSQISPESCNPRIVIIPHGCMGIRVPRRKSFDEVNITTTIGEMMDICNAKMLEKLNFN
ncbi:hypothetical protein ACFL21_03705 [Patescibacteria group bacterium]